MLPFPPPMGLGSTVTALSVSLPLLPLHMPLLLCVLLPLRTLPVVSAGAVHAAAACYKRLLLRLIISQKLAVSHVHQLRP